MSAGLNLNLSLILPPSAQWILEWTEQVLNATSSEVLTGRSPYPPVLRVLRGIFYPSVAGGFEPQLYFLIGLFCLSILVLLAALALRLKQGRLWLLHRLDKTILIPNLSVIYCLCALAYAGIGILSAVTAIRIAEGEPFPRYYIGIQAGWIAPLWLGFWCETWATFSAWYIRKKGAFYRESRLKTVIASTLPFAVPVLAWTPPVVLFCLAARQFNRGFRDMEALSDTLREADAAWTPAKGFDIPRLLPFFQSGIEFANTMRQYWRLVRAGYIFLGIVLVATFLVYAIGASLEIAHLTRTIHMLRSQVRADPPAAKKPDITAQLDDEFFEGTKRQAKLLTWARNNRLYSAIAISLMLVVNAGLTFWLGVTPLSITSNSAQFQVEILVACWFNGTLSTVVAILILFRSLDGGSHTVYILRRVLPFLPFPPEISLTDPSRATTRDWKTSRVEEPPKYPGSPGWAADDAAAAVVREDVVVEDEAVELSEKRPAPGPSYLVPPPPPPTAALPPRPSSSSGSSSGDKARSWRKAPPSLDERSALGDAYDLDLALDTAWYGFGSTHGGNVAHGLRVELDGPESGPSSSAAHGVEMVEASMSGMRWLPALGHGHALVDGDDEAALRGRADSWDAQSGSMRLERAGSAGSCDKRSPARPDSRSEKQ
ncbi:hypothetical protein JCM3775_000425 [Rhodotorula graminis]|uniref:Proteophosphoglycan ppg4 n=1 Tax=Rhodotorula graminis (strain WP1) TaxID=578459 RepID=A0A194S9Q5_RHOGW|nr:uncharacterized protein RHOBADRAFT_41450 [Rhodotorula graminis WP1]KPV77458.1 hypothetical protein RHOBADRAFT_41450 [Rhodotorula graminis WP1]